MRRVQAVIELALRSLQSTQTVAGSWVSTCQPAAVEWASNSLSQGRSATTRQFSQVCSFTFFDSRQPCSCLGASPKPLVGRSKHQQQQQQCQFSSTPQPRLSASQGGGEGSGSSEDSDEDFISRLPSVLEEPSSSDEDVLDPDLAAAFSDEDYALDSDSELSELRTTARHPDDTVGDMFAETDADEDDDIDLPGARSPLLGGGGAGGDSGDAAGSIPLPTAAGIPAPGGGSWEDMLEADDAREGLSPKQIAVKRAMLDYIVRGRYSVNPPKEESLPDEWKHLAHDPHMREFVLASKKKKKFIMEQALAGRWGPTLPGAEQDGAGEALPERGFRDEDSPSDSFRMHVVDINRTSKGTKAGGVLHFTAMCVVGNGEGVLGHGTGRANDVSSAVVKAHARALERLTYVPRYRGHTIYYPTKEKYGKSIVIMYPKSSGSGIKASILVDAVCRLAGIKDVGVKVQGSRNARNTVKALFQAFDDMSKIDETMLEGTSAQQQASL